MDEIPTRLKATSQSRVHDAQLRFQLFLFLKLLALWLFFAPLAALGEQFSARVVSVLDGDTIEVLSNNRTERIRLHGIDCPEKGQAYGMKAKQATSRLVFGKKVTLETHGRDKYGLTIADVSLPDGIIINIELVRNGWCWWYQQYAPDNVMLAELQRRARRSRLGLWADPDPVPPWLYRRLKSGTYP